MLWSEWQWNNANPRSRDGQTANGFTHTHSSFHWSKPNPAHISLPCRRMIFIQSQQKFLSSLLTGPVSGQAWHLNTLWGLKVEHGTLRLGATCISSDCLIQIFFFVSVSFFPFQTRKHDKKKKARPSLRFSHLHHWKHVVQEQWRLLLVAGCNLGLCWCVCVSNSDVYGTRMWCKGIYKIQATQTLTLSHIYFFVLPLFGLNCPAKGAVVLHTDVNIFYNDA